MLVEGEGGHFSVGADIAEFDEVYRDFAAARDYGDAVQAGLKALIELIVRRSLCCREMQSEEGWDWLSPATCASAPQTPIAISRRSSDWSTVTPRRGASSNLSDRRAQKTSCSQAGGSRPRKRLRSGSSTVGSRWGCTTRRSATPAASQGSVKRRSAAPEGRSRRSRRAWLSKCLASPHLVWFAALGVDFVEGRAAFAEKRAAKFSHRGRRLLFRKADANASKAPFAG